MGHMSKLFKSKSFEDLFFHLLVIAAVDGGCQQDAATVIHKFHGPVDVLINEFVTFVEDQEVIWLSIEVNVGVVVDLVVDAGDLEYIFELVLVFLHQTFSGVYEVDSVIQ